MSDRVPHAFEKRVMAGLRIQAVPDGLAEWTTGFWQAALSGAAIAVLLVGLNAADSSSNVEASTVDDLEAAVVASTDPMAES